MDSYYLAVDIGASSGRHILGHIESGKLITREIFRFENSPEYSGKSLVWNIKKLLDGVTAGIKKCADIGIIPKSIAIDTWGVDYVLLGSDGKVLPPVFSYRDSRTASFGKDASQCLSPDELYNITGIQNQNFNTVYQLICDKRSGKLALATQFLMIPDYINYELTGTALNEYSNATTTSLINHKSGSWDKQILTSFGFDENIFLPLQMPACKVGRLKPEIRELTGVDAAVVSAPSHDTACAVAACPLKDGSVYISSGTWSLIGTELNEPIITPQSLAANFTNEGGVEKRYRFLKNIMGMWLFQNIRKELDSSLSFGEMMNLAKSSSYKKTFECNDARLTAPKSIIAEIKSLLGEDSLTTADLLNSVYYSLAYSYLGAIEDIERLTSKKIDNIIIVGGGSKDEYLNRLTAKITGRKVTTGLYEATAIGNIASQIMADKKVTLTEVRKIINSSFSFKEVR